MPSDDLSLTVKFYYGIEKSMSREVLFKDYTFKNLSNTDLTFTLYNSEITVSVLEPKNRVKLTKVTRPCGAPASPTQEDVIRLAPGQEHVHRSWEWSEWNSLGLATYKGDQVEYYTIPDNTELTVKLCINLVDSTEIFNHFKCLKPKETLLERKVCSNTFKFKYKVVHENGEN